MVDLDITGQVFGIPYTQARRHMESGDALLVKSRKFASILIRVLTGESFNHSAMIVRTSNGVFVAEMREGRGFLWTPASQWMEQRGRDVVMWGKAPVPVRGHPHIEPAVMRTRYARTPYSLWTLPKVWWSQIRNRDIEGRAVCSTWIQSIWRQFGYDRFRRLADPGDLLEHGRDWNRISA